MEKFVDHYLERINYEGSTAANLATLQALQRHHLLRVPFENLDIHLGRPIVLDLEKIFDKVVKRKRGGFCYELNGLFCELLRRLGYQVRRIAANVYDKEKGYGLDYDHLSLLVTLDGIDYLTDVGFGKFTFTPLKLQTDKIQQDEQGEFVIHTTEEGYFRVSKKEDKAWVPQYIFQSQGREYAEFEPMCHYHQTSPDSHFTSKILMSLMKPDGRVTITGNVFKIDQQGVVTEQTFGEEGFNAILAQYFDVHI
jgi:N-hydroxyarylamine O-acetyltransferase